LTAILTAIPDDEPLFKTINPNSENGSIKERRATMVSKGAVKGGQKEAKRGVMEMMPFQHSWLKSL
jgi:hypothetical protein